MKPICCFKKTNTTLLGTFNVMRLCAEQMAKQEPEGFVIVVNYFVAIFKNVYKFF